MIKQFTESLTLFTKIKAILLQGKKGVEKENIRITEKGYLSQNNHPTAFGSALTHQYITKDFAESMIELVTPPFQDLDELYCFLEQLHRYVYQNLKIENLWPNSMPPKILDDLPVSIAKFGKSNNAKLKETYRRGLKLRYGDKMQIISGWHFNYSYPQELWTIFKNISSQQKFKNEKMLGAARNFLRFHWLIIYLFGDTPTFNKGLEKIDTQKNSVSFRNLIYKNKDKIKISYNDFTTYCKDLLKTIQTKKPSYQKFEITKNNRYHQLNDNILQIENELYFPIRIKPLAVKNERPLLSLQKKGIHYFEIRCLDLQHQNPLGIEKEQLYFLELFLLFCFILPSPPLTEGELEEIDSNKQAICTNGKDPQLLLTNQNKQVNIQDWGMKIFECLAELATLLDSDKLLKVIQQQKQVLQQSNKMPASRLKNSSFQEYMLKIAQNHKKYFLANAPNSSFTAMMELEQQNSIAKQLKIEQNDNITFDNFLNQYFKI